MQTGEWLKPGALNTIHYTIKLADGTKKEGQLRFTKSQQERFRAFQNEEKQQSDVELCEIALNPNHEAPEFTIEQIEGALDLDQIVLLNRIWLDKKVANPRLSRDLDPKFVA
jgi:hypothetical protein